jgi:hypothetical protein
MSFMDDAKQQMEQMRDEAEAKIDEARAEHGEDENGEVVSDDGTARGRSWSESSVTERHTP